MHTTLSYCWKIERTDGVTFFYTDHSKDLLFLGDTYKGNLGVSPTTISKKLGLSVDNLEVSGAFTEEITFEDIASGKFNGAEVIGYLVNWQDLGDYQQEFQGVLGEVTYNDFSFSVEARSLSTFVNQTAGRAYQRRCPYSFGDNDCTVDLGPLTQSRVVVSVVGSTIVFDGSAITDDLLSLGTLTYSDGTTQEIRFHTGNTVKLWEAPVNPVAPGDLISVTQGCKKDRETCKGFANVLNFGGFDWIPSEDVLTNVAVQGKDVYDGGSMWKAT